MLRFETCYKCGQRKLASFNIYTDKGLKTEDIEMEMMGWNQRYKGQGRKGQFRCKDCTKLPVMVEPEGMEHDEDDTLFTESRRDYNPSAGEV
jgi:hypothetical protein